MRRIGWTLALMAISPAAATAETLVVGNKGEDTISFIDLATGRELARPKTGRMPHEIAVSPDGKTIAVVAYGGKTIDLFDVASRARLRTIDLAPNEGPHGLIWLKDGRLVATAERSRSLVVIGPGDAVKAIPTGQEGTHMVAVSPDLTHAYVANMGSKTASVIDLAAGKKLSDLPAGKEPEGIALSPDGKRLWVADRGGDVVHVFDTGSLKEVKRIAVGKTPIRVAISPDGLTAVTSNYGGGNLTLIDTANLKVLRTIPVSGGSEAQQVTILFSPDGRRLFVAETGRDQVAEVDLATGKVLRRLDAGKNGDGLAVAP